MKIKYQLTPDEFVVMMNLHYSQYKKRKYIAYGLGLLFVCFVNWRDKLDVLFFATMLFYISFIVFTLKYLIPFAYKRQFKKEKLLHTTREMEFLEDNFTLKTENFDVTISYKAIEKVIRSDKFFLLYISSRVFHFLPVSAFESELKLFNELLKRMSIAVHTY
jgi:hypothetical protein